MRPLLTALAVLVVLGATRSLRLLEHPTLNCSQEALRCSVVLDNCSSERLPNQHTPNSPFVHGEPGVRRDAGGHLVPVLLLRWTARTDGSISALNGVEFRIQEVGSNRSICLQYIFHDKIQSMMNPQRKRWSSVMDRAVVLPGHTYHYRVSNLPKPQTGNNMVEETIAIPDCRDSMMQDTKVCAENGSLWKPIISWNISAYANRHIISVSFTTGELSEKYLVSVQCEGVLCSKDVWKGNSSHVSVDFSVGPHPELCCESVSIQPFFPLCSGNCAPQGEQLQQCHKDPSPPADVSVSHPLISATLGLFLACSFLALSLYKNKLKGGRPEEKYSQECAISCSSERLKHVQHSQATSQKKVLIIYSLDHTLYKDIVLKLTAFLQAKCGTEVVLDLLDTAWLGTVGRMQWLDWQKQQIEKSSDKILILCSRGVQAKWRAMCGGRRVMLKEDVRSPMGDMLTPAFSLIVPDLLHPVAFGKYIVAYFDDVSAEEDVPPPFNITIKYKLMKHFEELYFRILDMEKHEPGRVNRVEGIAEDEYFNCASGRALRDAIEAFQAHQLEYPDWFERECVDSEEEALESDLQCPLLADVNSISIQQCVPLCREEPPIFSNTINAIEGGREVLSLTPLIKDAEEDVFTQQVLPVTPLEENQVCAVLPVAHKERGPVYAALPAAHLECSRTYAVYTEALWKGRQRHLLNPGVEVYSLGTREDGIQHSVSVGSTANAVQVSVPGDTKPQGGLDSVGSAAEEREEELEFPGCLSADTLESLLALQQALVARNPLPCSPAEHELHDPQATGSVGQEPFPWRRPSSGSDQGYFSRVSPQQDSSLKEEVPEPESGGTTGPLHPTSYAAALCRSKKITP